MIRAYVLIIEHVVKDCQMSDKGKPPCHINRSDFIYNYLLYFINIIHKLWFSYYQFADTI